MLSGRGRYPCCPPVNRKPELTHFQEDKIDPGVAEVFLFLFIGFGLEGGRLCVFLAGGNFHL